MIIMQKVSAHIPVDAIPSIKRAARAENMSVSAWLRRMALDAAGYEPPSLRVRMEGVAGQPSKMVDLVDLVADLHRRGYGVQGIAAKTRAPYRRVCEIITQIKTEQILRSNAPPRVHTPEAAGQEEEGMTPAPLSSSAYSQEAA